MTRPLSTLVVLLGTAAAATPSAAGIAELLDPGAVAGSICRARPVRLAAATAATTPGLGDDLGIPGLGEVDLNVMTDDPDVEALVERGLALAYGFNHAESLRAFRAAQARDPGCALCFWGEALVLGPNINAPMAPDAVAPARRAAARAAELTTRASPLEEALVAAVVARYDEGGARDGAYASAMTEAAARFPADDDVLTLAAEALMDEQPWNYWEPGGLEGRGGTDRALAMLETVLARSPDHIGAGHLYIHLVEASAAPGRALPYADRLGRLAPASGHLVHMPSHIYYRVGRYRDSLAVNRQAVAVDEAYLARAGRRGVYGALYYPHNVHFALQSAMLLGDAGAALPLADRLGRESEGAADMQLMAVGRYFAYAMLAPPPATLALARPDDAAPVLVAGWRYARALARLATGDLAGARLEAEALEALRGDGFAGPAGGDPTRSVVAIADEVVRARVARAEGRSAEAVVALERAVGLQDRLPYMEPPFWHYPVRQTLGAALLEAGQEEDAVRAFEASLVDAPENGWALWGLARARRAAGDGAGAEEATRRFEAAWDGDPAALTLERL